MRGDSPVKRKMFMFALEVVIRDSSFGTAKGARGPGQQGLANNIVVRHYDLFFAVYHDSKTVTRNAWSDRA